MIRKKDIELQTPGDIEDNIQNLAQLQNDNQCMICLEDFVVSELSVRKDEIKKVSECGSPVIIGRRMGDGPNPLDSNASHLRESQVNRVELNDDQ